MYLCFAVTRRTKLFAYRTVVETNYIYLVYAVLPLPRFMLVISISLVYLLLSSDTYSSSTLFMWSSCVGVSYVCLLEMWCLLIIKGWRAFTFGKLYVLLCNSAVCLLIIWAAAHRESYAWCVYTYLEAICLLTNVSCSFWFVKAMLLSFYVLFNIMRKLSVCLL
jgi:hypothetical protein